jgi:subtilisin family serine protease
LVVRSGPGFFDAQTLLDLERVNGIDWAQPNYKYYLDDAGGQPLDPGPDDRLYREGKLWNLKTIGANKAWISTRKTTAIVAIIDSGVDYQHEDLAQNIWKNEREIPGNHIDDDKNGYVDDVCGYNFAAEPPQGRFFSTEEDSDPRDDLGHGTQCAGIIGAVGNNKLGVVGVAWDVKMMILRIYNSKGKPAKTSPKKL